MSETHDLTAAIRQHSCAESQVSWYYHKGYYQFEWDLSHPIYDHEHHTRCCEIIDGIHTPRKEYNTE